ncbi:MAG TPA: penicillin-binding protein 1C [Acetobacteraceae bacterium]|nr:penicillin-binding protein 1C [Acetobacteraceae bacterium]
MRRAVKTTLAVAGLLVGGLALLDRLAPPDLSRYQARSVAVLDHDGALLDMTTAPDGIWRLGANAGDVDPNYLHMLLRTEDARFWWHPGVDPFALLRAVFQLAWHGHIVSGGSTLTMQVARLLTPHRHTILGKLLDIARALQLEAHYSKRQILAMYLTLAPEGGNIEGVRAASLIWFQHEPAHLTDAESALLIALPRSPRRLRPDRHPIAAAAAMRTVLARAEPGLVVADLRLPAHRMVPHSARHLLDRLRSMGRRDETRTTLSAPLQRAAEALVTREQPWLGEHADIAALLVRNADRAVLAYVGGSGYFGPNGMIDMVRRRRSPGSTLKPFIYAMAFDDALATPDTLIDDSRIRFGDYAPHDFDRLFHGSVTIREALQQSYNLPAVQLLARVGPDRFLASLRQAGVALSLPRLSNGAGLAIALGGVAISLQDLTKLYVALADRGEVRPLRLLANDPPATPVPLMTAAGARQVSDILRQAPLPDGLVRDDERPIAYKTGTSYGFRDAWAAGTSGAYTVVVWTGRPDGTPRPGAFGRNTAAPIMFGLFDLLPTERDASGPLSTRLDASVLSPALVRFAGPPILRIVFPPPGATMESSASDGTVVPIGLEASGGIKPYRWFVNGLPLARPPVGLGMTWTPDGVGFMRLSVVDAMNRTASEDVRVR